MQSPSQLVLLTRRWRPADFKLDPFHEVVINDGTAEELKKQVGAQNIGLKLSSIFLPNLQSISCSFRAVYAAWYTVYTPKLHSVEKHRFGISLAVHVYNRGFARCGTHLYAPDFVLPHGFLFVLCGIEKNNKTPFYFEFLRDRN